MTVYIDSAAVLHVISIIIPAYNEEASLPATLNALHEAGRALGRPYEIVVSNDDSSDRTAEVAEAHGARVAHVKNRQIAATRNGGAKAARGDYFIFVDADTFVPEETLRAAVRLMDEGAAGGGAIVLMDEPMAWYYRMYLAAFMKLLVACRYAAGCYIFARREAFEAVGGFDERYFASEEVHLSKALKRQGHFEVLPYAVITSARKLRMYTPWQIFGLILKMMMRGPGVLRKRDGLDIWYDGKRE